MAGSSLNLTPPRYLIYLATPRVWVLRSGDLICHLLLSLPPSLCYHGMEGHTSYTILRRCFPAAKTDFGALAPRQKNLDFPHPGVSCTLRGVIHGSLEGGSGSETLRVQPKVPSWST